MRIVVTLLVLVSCVGVQTQAPGIQYAYDLLGRLIAVIDLNGDTARYIYDAAGNLLSIQRYASSQTSIISFVPSSGTVGSLVTVSGTGFSATAGQNVITFGGVATESLVSTTTTQLVVVVPRGATTGPIGVTSPAGSATTDVPFTVMDDAGIPTISSFAPAIGLPGTAISIAGTNFDVPHFNNRMTLNASRMDATAGNKTALSTSVPYRAMGGRIQIATARGSAVAESDFYVPPSPYTPSDVSVTDRMAVGTSKTVTIATGGKVALVLFEGNRGQRVSMRITSSTITRTQIAMYRPDGPLLFASSATSAAGGFVEPQVLPVTGSYTVLIDPDSSYVGSLTLSAYDVVDVGGPIPADGTGVPVSITTPGQNARLTFSGTAGQVVTARMTNGTLSSYCFVSSLSIVKSDGTTVGTANSCSGSSAFLDQVTLPTTGVYTLLFNPDTTQTGNATLALYTVLDVTGPITADGTAVSTPITTPGQNARLTFSGTAGQIVAARVANGTLSSYCYVFSLSIVKSDGAILGTSKSCSGSAAFLDQLMLPTTGTYTVVFNPDTTQTGQATLALYTVVDVTGSIAADGTSVPVSITTPGQNARLTFSGTAGQIVTARVANGTFSSYCFVFSLSIVKSDGSTLAASNSCSGSSAVLTQKTLPATGAYTFFLNPDTSQTGAATLTLTSP
jgi:YD repeat-containing protein